MNNKLTLKHKEALEKYVEFCALEISDEIAKLAVREWVEFEIPWPAQNSRSKPRRQAA